ncbi:hypothetical protein C6A37_13545, partial [Desulfobacteraceae bacterium SEEP-SAG9]
MKITHNRYFRLNDLFFEVVFGNIDDHVLPPLHIVNPKHLPAQHQEPITYLNKKRFKFNIFLAVFGRPRKEMIYK